MSAGLKTKLLKAAQPGVLIICLTLLAFSVIYETEQTAVLSIIFITLSMVPFLLRFEHSRPKPRDITPIVVMSVIAAVGRAVFNVVPGFQPVTAILIITGMTFGPQAGFMSGALTVLVSNMFLGHGPWTPWQMLGWSLSGYTAGLLAKTFFFKKNIYVIIYGFVVSILYGWFLNIWVLAGFVKPITWQAFAGVYAASAYIDILHAISTVLFLSFTLKPWSRKLLRIKQKYGIN